MSAKKDKRKDERRIKDQWKVKDKRKDKFNTFGSLPRNVVKNIIPISKAAKNIHKCHRIKHQWNFCRNMVLIKFISSKNPEMPNGISYNPRFYPFSCKSPKKSIAWQINDRINACIVYESRVGWKWSSDLSLDSSLICYTPSAGQ